MKKFISMVMAAAMVVSLVPATAFAADEVTYKVVKAQEYTKDEAKKHETEKITTAELQLKVADLDKLETEGDENTWEITLDFENAEIRSDVKAVEDTEGLVDVTVTEDGKVGDDTITLELKDNGYLAEDDVIAFDLAQFNLVLTRSSVGTEATVTVSGDFNTSDEMVFATVLDKGIKAKVKKVVDVAPEETVTLDKITVEPTVGSNFDAVCDAGDIMKLKLSKGFEFQKTRLDGGDINSDEDVIEIKLTADDVKADKFEYTKGAFVIVADDAKEGDVCELTIKVGKNDSVKIEVAKVVAEDVVIELEDADDDVPEMWSGVNSANYGLTADTDEHKSLEVTFKESFPGSLGTKDEFEFTLPEGVWATDVTITDVKGDADFVDADLRTTFEKAYKEGDHKSFVFEKRDFIAAESEKTEIEFTMQFTLVADPGFVGDVVLGVVSEDITETEMTIATFKTPMMVEAQANDLIIDYRNTVVPTSIVVKEAEAGLWDKDELQFGFALDRYIDFEDDATFTVNEESEMELDCDTKRVSDDVNDGNKVLYIELDEESDDEAGVITISDISLYMSRNIAAGAYDLEMVYNTAADEFEAEPLFAPDVTTAGHKYVDDHVNGKCEKECFVGDVTDYSKVVKEGFVNVITAGRDKDDASFTTKVVVPVGESYMIAGEQTVALDVPAYVSASGYTMLPVRAVAVALGILNNNVLWDQASKTVTILYGQRIITMTVGAKVINVNGSAIPASSSPEVVDGRTFLPMRDLATALGVTDITWDAATKTATLNGNK